MYHDRFPGLPARIQASLQLGDGMAGFSEKERMDACLAGSINYQKQSLEWPCLHFLPCSVCIRPVHAPDMK
jgi:hypothetical protein